MGSGIAALMGVLSGTPGLEAGMEAGDKQQLAQEKLNEEKRYRQMQEAGMNTNVGSLYKTLGLPTPAGVDDSTTVPTSLAAHSMAAIEREQARKDEAAQMKNLSDTLTR